MKTTRLYKVIRLTKKDKDAWELKHSGQTSWKLIQLRESSKDFKCMTQTNTRNKETRNDERRLPEGNDRRNNRNNDLFKLHSKTTVAFRFKPRPLGPLKGL